MNRMMKLIVAVFFVFVIMVSAISIGQNLLKPAKLDLTQYKLYSLSDGTKKILGKLNQPVTLKLYYAQTAAMKGPDQIKQYNDYYNYVRAVLEEYQRAGGGKVKLEIIDPRPYSLEEQEALKFNLKRFNITETEGFFFGLVARTEYGASKTIEFFSPDRQSFIEYDISYLLDTIITRDKNKIGVISSLPVMGDEMDGYMAQMMRMQGQQPQPAWTFVRMLQERYTVTKIENEVDEIKDIDILLVIHPKELPEKTLFAIDQFVLKGGRAVVCVDPHCMADQPDRAAQMQGQAPRQSSSLEKLLNAWGVTVAEDKFAGDPLTAMSVPLKRNASPEPLIGYLGLTPEQKCFNKDNVISSNLNNVRVLFSGVVSKYEPAPAAPAGAQGENKDAAQPAADAGATLTPLLCTSGKGNTWTVSSPYELMMLDGARLMKNFKEGNVPMVVAGVVTGKFRSAFPQGIEVAETPAEKKDENQPDQAAEEKKEDEPATMKKVTGLTEAAESGMVIVVADVDFISDMIAFQNSMFGTMTLGDNSALMTNAIESLVGSGDLIAIRSRGNFQRPFSRVEAIKKEAEKKTLAKEEDVKKDIEAFQQQLRDLVSKSRQEGKTVIDASALSGQQRDLELKLNEKNRELIAVQNERRVGIEELGRTVQGVNMLAAPSVILLIAIVLAVRRVAMRRKFAGTRCD